jgi:hypothetical protein
MIGVGVWSSSETGEDLSVFGMIFRLLRWWSPTGGSLSYLDPESEKKRIKNRKNKNKNLDTKVK